MAWGEELTTVALERGTALVGYAYLLTGDLDSARDLVQEALVRTYGLLSSVETREGGAQSHVTVELSHPVPAPRPLAPNQSRPSGV